MLYAECTQKDGEFSSQLKIFTVNRVSDGQVFKIRSEWTESTGHRESFWAKVEKVSRPTEPTDHRFFWDLNEITIDAENTFPLPTSALKTMKIEFLSSDPYQIKDSRGRNFKNCSITNH